MGGGIIGKFTCYLMSTRSRGLSGVSADLDPDRRLGDVVSSVESIGEPARIFGESDGGVLALGTAAHTSAVSAVAAYEPPVLEVFTEDILVTFEAIVGRVAEAVADDRVADAARIFSELVANDDETVSLEASGYFEEAGRAICRSTFRSLNRPSSLRQRTRPILRFFPRSRLRSCS